MTTPWNRPAKQDFVTNRSTSQEVPYGKGNNSESHEEG
jgi:hypothetical protein